MQNYVGEIWMFAILCAFWFDIWRYNRKQERKKIEREFLDKLES